MTKNIFCITITCNTAAAPDGIRQLTIDRAQKRAF